MDECFVHALCRLKYMTSLTASQDLAAWFADLFQIQMTEATFLSDIGHATPPANAWRVTYNCRHGCAAVQVRADGGCGAVGLGQEDAGLRHAPHWRQISGCVPPHVRSHEVTLDAGTKVNIRYNEKAKPGTSDACMHCA